MNQRLSVRMSVLISLCLIAGCDFRQKVHTSDGKVDIVLPTGWLQTTIANSHAKLSAKNILSTGYASVLVDAKQDLVGQDLQAYARLCMNNSRRSSKLQNRVADDPINSTINNIPVVIYRVSGSLNGTNIVYRHIFMQTDSLFVQVMGWSTPSNFEGNKADFDAIVANLTEHKK